MEMIVAVDRNWAIGYREELLARISADLIRFRKMTTGKTVILGRKTLATFPQGKPLPKRRNLVMTTNPGLEIPGATVCTSLETVAQYIANLPSEDVFIIGGQQIYELFLPYCSVAHITRIDRAFPADRHIPALDQLPGWVLLDRSTPQQQEDLTFYYETYRQTSPRPLP